MPALLLAALALALPAAPPAEPAPATATPAEMTDGQKLSYALGVNVARGLLRDGLDPDPALFLAGLRDTLTGAPPRMTDAELAAALDAAAAKVRAAAAESRIAAGKAAAEASAEFLREFAAEDGARKLAGGVLARPIAAGDGPKPTPADRVRLHYAATVAGAGEPFFTTRGGDPAAVPVAALLPGLRTALPEMPVGSRWRVAVPADLAYGETGGPGVPPNAALLVEVELLGVLPPAATRPGDANPGQSP